MREKCTYFIRNLNFLPGERGYRVIVYEKRPQQWFEDTAGWDGLFRIHIVVLGIPILRIVSLLWRLFEGKSKSFSRHVGVLVSERGIYHLRRFGLTQDEIGT